jgi:ADP-ribose pyrophosphatase YjhB (NUDIX family)
MAPRRLITTRGIIYREGKLFLQTLHVNDFWSTPGGKLDPLEKIEDGLRRELLEETGVVADVGRLLFTQQFKADDYDLIEFFFHIKNPEDFEHVDLASTTHGEAEVAKFGFVDPKVEKTLPAFLGEVDIQSYIDEVKPVGMFNEL